MQKISPVPWPATFVFAVVLGLAGCGGGSSDSAATPDDGPVMVDAFGYAATIVSSGTADTAEPREVGRIVLSTTETDEPEIRL